MRMLRAQVEIVNFWTLVTKDSDGGWGILGRNAERPVFHTFMLYQQMGKQLVAADAGLHDVLGLPARQQLELGALVGQQHLGLAQARHALQGLLHAPDAGRAMHAADVQGD